MHKEKTDDAVEAMAEITFEMGWNLPHAGTAPFRYLAHVSFESDPKGKENLWTLFVELEQPPEAQRKVYIGKIFFFSPVAPSSLLAPGEKFELSIGPMVKAHGVVKEMWRHL